MRIPRLVLAMATLLIGVGLSGCVGTAAATAMESRDPAQSRAKAWDAGAVLAGVIGLEGSLNDDWMTNFFRDLDDCDAAGHFQDAADDGDLGDGHALVWGYLYVADGKNTGYGVLVNADEDVLCDRELDLEDAPMPIDRWEIDSDAALETALAASSGLRQGLESDQYGIVQVLGRQQGRPEANWIIMGGGPNATGGTGGIVILNAVTGEVLAETPLDPLMMDQRPKS